MQKAKHYYYSDSTFELELNLQNIRLELIRLIDEFEQQDCVGCYHVKCRCRDGDNTTITSATTSSYAPSRKFDGSPIAPPADTLPRPMFGNSDESPGASTPERETVITDVEAWLRSCGKLETPETKVSATDALLANLRKCSVSPAKVPEVTQPKEVNGGNAVEAFFNSFKFQPYQNGTSTPVAYVPSKVATSYIKQQTRKAEYTYF